MAPRFAEVADPVGESVIAIWSYIPSVSRISLPDLPFVFGYVAKQTARLCAALLGPVKAASPPRGSALWLLTAAALLLLLRYAFLCCAARRILRAHGQARHLKKDL